MSRLCERPGCSEPGETAYGVVPEDLLFWISPLDDAPVAEPGLLCRRHADAMVVPRGWTLDDRRNETLRLFKVRPVEVVPVARKQRRLVARGVSGDAPEQLQIDGTGEMARPDPPAPEWQPDFDADDDLDGLLTVSSPLLARAFRGRPRR